MNSNEKKIPTEIWSRVVGYFQPVKQWNKGKKEEFRERKCYNVSNDTKFDEEKNFNL